MYEHILDADGTLPRRESKVLMAVVIVHGVAVFGMIAAEFAGYAPSMYPWYVLVSLLALFAVTMSVMSVVMMAWFEYWLIQHDE